MATHRHNSPAFPAGVLFEIHDMLTLALDATERFHGYSQEEREARSYIRTARRRAERLMEAVQ